MRTRDVLAGNLRRLMAAVGWTQLPQVVEASNGALSNGTLDRVRRASHATGVDTLEAIAEVFGIEPWQLLVPTLQAQKAQEADQGRVRLTGVPEWPFSRVDVAKFMKLPAERRAFVEGLIASELASLEAPDPEDMARFQAAHPQPVKQKQTRSGS